MYKFLKKARITRLVRFLLVILTIFLFTSCSTTTSTDTDKFVVSYPNVSKVNQDVEIRVDPLEPGLSNIWIRIENESFEKAKVLTNYPYIDTWKPEKGGFYKVTVSGYSLTEGKWHTKEGTITVFDVIPPYIEDIRMIPEKPYVGDEVLLQLKLKSENPVVDLSLSGKAPSSTWLNYTTTSKPGYVYMRLPQLNASGDVELFVKSRAYDSEDATKLVFNVRQVDRAAPTINVFTKTFYPENGDISFTLKLYDNEELARYVVEFDGQKIIDESINGRTFEKAVLIGKKDLGTHTLNIVAYDKEGNMAHFAKTILVGSAALSFEVEISPSNPTAGSTAVIALVPQEKNVTYTKVVFFVDGKAIKTSTGSEGEPAITYALWDVEEGPHTITVYAESADRRAGIAETVVSVPDRNGPQFIALYANDRELKKDQANYVFPGLVTFKIKVYDPGGVSTSVLPRLLIKEDEFAGFYRDLQMGPDEISSDGKTVTFSVSTTMALGYYYVTVINVQDLSGNAMRDIGNFLLYVQ
ncbi:MAG: hypothetical protein ACUVQF_03710 [Fervidobacterium sp.]|uniref:hypothetical protein n=1 Tax=Fervidobacterium sp. TaxID=1871331 RepID=UPI00404A189F